MGEPASEDLRKRVVCAYERGEGTYAEIAKRFDVGEASVSRWLQLYRATGSIAPRPHGGGARAKIDAEGLELLVSRVRAQPDITLAELARLYAAEREVTLALSIICRALNKRGLGRKKKSSTRASKRPIASSSSAGSSLGSSRR